MMINYADKFIRVTIMKLNEICHEYFYTPRWNKYKNRCQWVDYRCILSLNLNYCKAFCWCSFCTHQNLDHWIPICRHTRTETSPCSPLPFHVVVVVVVVAVVLLVLLLSVVCVRCFPHMIHMLFKSFQQNISFPFATLIKSCWISIGSLQYDLVSKKRTCPNPM